jgi:pilus assembly protein CpaF
VPALLRHDADLPGSGPVQALLDDDTVEEIRVKEPSRVFVAREGSRELTLSLLGPIP